MLIKLAENKSKRVQVAKVGTFDHEIYGQFSIKLSALEQMKVNFESNVRRQKLDGVPVLPLDYKHDEQNIAAGWIKGLEIEEDKNGVKGLFAEVEWTPLGAQKVRDREFAFISPSIRPLYKDKETNQNFNNVLLGATLTNIPFLRDMEAVHLLSESRRKAFQSLKLSGDNPDLKIITGGNMPNSVEMLKLFATMSPDEQKSFFDRLSKSMGSRFAEDKKELSELSEMFEISKTELKKAQDSLKLSEDENKNIKQKMSGSNDVADRLKLSEITTKDLKEKVGSLTKKLAENEQKAEFDQMLSGGKACEAQRKSFMKGDIAEFAKNAQEFKLNEDGENDKGNESSDDAADKIITLSDARAREDKISHGDATSLILSENKELARKAGY